MRPIPLLVVVGTRPDAVKMAPVVLELRADPAFAPILVATAQHREMLDQVLRLFRLTPDVDLDVMRPRQTLTEVTARTLVGLDACIRRVRPEMVLVQGDAAPSFCGALAAFYHRVPVAHVEAGLRTRDKYHPFPEEMYRRMTGALADLHFAPTPGARQNLLQEGVEAGRIYVTGNTVIDALWWITTRDPPPDLGLPVRPDARMILVTAHRRESWGEPLRRICMAVRTLVGRFEDVEVVFPVHRNPAVREVAFHELGDLARVHLLDPPDYGSFVSLERRAYLILTDSGGVQEEAPAFGTPVLVLRETTERPEGIEAGVAKLVGTDPDRIVEEASRLLRDPEARARMANAVNPYGDGRAAARIRQILRVHFGLQDRLPEPFEPASPPVGEPAIREAR
ncbi:MAG: UDP-N-acetylglucosamine 2-epimerase (non-hydrolyzing) [Armatimonadota bacterium]|nr:UDP-N-acetylglucosamine 2-epimerase (non-hydrolyzing) [Armatimonadota bacterium]MDR7439816.1 UDP-N-acetylglucosamine 2-epimerase (non-hydrolyzing) [Armatimonadota bacterium]MDR7563706.1 UDP-N-acetylglucosamine 2-epimerase (non-hydrolyzing) [Armatimonadota bacterium]MDR7568549.1 UDP-N-acetylglucosamine 2-epimerase (non-hydrolyzing) [Armatimonadota bacterium]MDR7601654.1 UDP-N-acetylglucosamine 2-epimerase (non-hydrolyzing) [Armatimonadota bacterium]